MTSKHPPFKEVENSRPPWREDVSPTYTRTRNPDWKPGEGANDGGASLSKKHVEIDPYAEGRAPILNYKLLISAVVPRPIGFMSTRSRDGTKTNLSPFSFFQMIGFDPPLFVFGIVGSPTTNPKDSLRNAIESGECVINIISEHFIEAANFTSIDAPYGVSEFAVSGLHMAPSAVVSAPRVQEAIFSVEARLVETREYKSKLDPSRTSSTMLVVEGVRFWAREDAINDDRDRLDPAILRPMSRLGGISYGRLTEMMELPRPEWAKLDEEEKRKFSSQS
ncbi:hypothetical protein VTN96DRAFT_1321 [Rasamsonia emersonii]|uniref:Flavoprotein oxygenase n=1 Tax=Rasamsonia emersonii (strain ATCC 16479 / CBS 393.64 / IMI 116815) TaxID=1408163 RepID=A0A0F4YDI6_RASE3|nr:Flavoprotein oxygenase [Rasamsonia emersonii CBS 393.64]KKA16282.1 Flavoprotein oxygenase [Rasamsonia emersonii CBS 393.64]